MKSFEMFLPELVDGIDEFTGRRQLVTRLQSLNKIVQFETDCRQAMLRSSVFPVALWVRLHGWDKR